MLRRWAKRTTERFGIAPEKDADTFGRDQSSADKKDQTLRRLRERLRSKDQEIQALRAMLTADETAPGGVRPENIVWIFGNGRSGSTWLASMIGEVRNGAVWSEPLVGLLFGDFYYLREGEKRGAKFVMGPRYKDVWLRNIRSMVLDGATARHADIPEGGKLVIKEPHGSIGAPLLAEALPESRMILLVRDPRDVVASYSDAFREEGWASGILFLGEGERQTRPDQDADAYVRERASVYLRDVGKAKEAYDAHAGPKALVRYEDLRADPQAVLGRACAELGMAVNDEAELARVVEAHAWENIPEEDKGEGKFRRKASPGSWREDLTQEQAKIVESVTAPLLDQFYPGWRKKAEREFSAGAS